MWKKEIKLPSIQRFFGNLDLVPIVIFRSLKIHRRARRCDFGQVKRAFQFEPGSDELKANLVVSRINYLVYKSIKQINKKNHVRFYSNTTTILQIIA